MGLAADFHITTAVAAAEAVQFGYNHDASQAWTDILVSLVQGIATLPLALIIVWLLHRIEFDRWAFVSAVTATIAALVATVLLELLGLNIWGMVVVSLRAIGLHPFVYEFWPALVILLIGSFLFALWLKRISAKSEARVVE
ncbi:hypothetical protein [Aurantiacibacter sediminis]|uniref:Uncharacterized protein n=1 Tax=Aurantiacibacter sediminis TaxID=2793064 RepID=A0ABS0N328_9SPHN|nr:hypothetical protein [Aurantiacibacter sediminis]MBH5322352.1 hypothetical protein [Aurantiacibacter sediminis]